MPFEQPKTISEQSKTENPPDKTESVDFNPEAWEKIQDFSRPADTIKEGRKIGVPPAELEKFAQENIRREIEKGNPDDAFDFMFNMKFGAAEQLRQTGEAAYKLLMSEKNYFQAQRIAEAAFGQSSEQYSQATSKLQKKLKQSEERFKKQGTEKEKYIEVKIPPGATFADLFAAIDAINEDDIDDFPFEEELQKNFPDLIQEIDSIEDNPELASTTKVVEFFVQRGYEPDDISTFLPIKFSKSKRSK